MTQAGTVLSAPYWLDAQLPPQLAPWLTLTFGVPAFSVAYLGYQDAADTTIFEAARRAGAIIATKDSDFLDRVQRRGSPPKLLYITSGNSSARHLKSVFLNTFPEAHRLLSGEENIVEIGG